MTRSLRSVKHVSVGHFAPYLPLRCRVLKAFWPLCKSTTQGPITYRTETGFLYLHRLIGARSIKQACSRVVRVRLWVFFRIHIHRRGQDFLWRCTFFLKKLMTFLVVVLNTRAKLTTTTLQPSPVQLPSKNFLQKLTSYSAWGGALQSCYQRLSLRGQGQSQDFPQSQGHKFFKGQSHIIISRQTETVTIRLRAKICIAETETEHAYLIRIFCHNAKETICDNDDIFEVTGSKVSQRWP